MIAILLQRLVLGLLQTGLGQHRLEVGEQFRRHPQLQIRLPFDLEADQSLSDAVCGDGHMNDLLHDGIDDRFLVRHSLELRFRLAIPRLRGRL
jgi:hypothetical protein